jgi:hypothetical protein
MPATGKKRSSRPSKKHRSSRKEPISKAKAGARKAAAKKNAKGIGKFLGTFGTKAKASAKRSKPKKPATKKAGARTAAKRGDGIRSKQRGGPVDRATCGEQCEFDLKLCTYTGLHETHRCDSHRGMP